MKLCQKGHCLSYIWCLCSQRIRSPYYARYQSCAIQQMNKENMIYTDKCGIWPEWNPSVCNEMDGNRTGEYDVSWDAPDTQNTRLWVFLLTCWSRDVLTEEKPKTVWKLDKRRPEYAPCIKTLNVYRKLGHVNKKWKAYFAIKSGLKKNFRRVGEQDLSLPVPFSSTVLSAYHREELC